MGSGPDAPFELVAGDPALDLLNTVSWRHDAERRIERIPDFAALARWSLRAGLCTPAAARKLTGGAASENTARVVRDLREDLYAIVEAHIEHRKLPAAALQRLTAHFVQAVQRAEPDALPLNWEIPLLSHNDLVDVLAIRAVRLLESDAVRRIGRCADATCGWVFVDQTRNHSRRWCSSTDCGNRARAARHYARRRAAN